MRVEIVEKIPERRAEMTEAPKDIALKLALKNFNAAMQHEDSLFEKPEAEIRPVTSTVNSRGCCSGETLLRFRDKEFGRSQTMHVRLIEKLSELLKDAGSSEALTARLGVTSKGSKKTDEVEHSLWIQLDAVGDSSEHAILRWGLGLARLQQALLFTCRYLRQRTSEKGG